MQASGSLLSHDTRSLRRKSAKVHYFGGGVLIHAGGTLLGAVSVSGDASDVDETCAINAVLGRQLQPEPATAEDHQPERTPPHDT
jgi:uncharacterized protein GlcG (DUF336 family)